jgi:hypothetical protein
MVVWRLGIRKNGEEGWVGCEEEKSEEGGTMKRRRKKRRR